MTQVFEMTSKLVTNLSDDLAAERRRRRRPLDTSVVGSGGGSLIVGGGAGANAGNGRVGGGRQRLDHIATRTPLAAIEDARIFAFKTELSQLQLVTSISRHQDDHSQMHIWSHR